MSSSVTCNCKVEHHCSRPSARSILRTCSRHVPIAQAIIFSCILVCTLNCQGSRTPPSCMTDTNVAVGFKRERLEDEETGKTCSRARLRPVAPEEKCPSTAARAYSPVCTDRAPTRSAQCPPYLWRRAQTQAAQAQRSRGRGGGWLRH